MDDFVVNVRQIGQYPPATAAAATDLLLLQQGGLAGPYASITPQNLVSTALQNAGTLLLSANTALIWPNAGFNVITGPLGPVFSFTQPIIAPGLTSNGSIEAIGNITADGDVSVAGNVYAGGRLLATVDNAVTSFNGRSGAVLLELPDILRGGGAPIWNPHFGGNVTAPTVWDFRQSDDTVATTAWVQLVVQQLICGGSLVTSFNGRTGAITLTVEDVNAAYAAAVAPDWPTAPNPAIGDASNRIATTLFVDDSLQDLQQWMINYLASGGGIDLSQYAPLASPAFTGTPSAPTAAPGSSTGQLATTAFVQAAVVASTTGVSSFNTRTGAVVLTLADVTSAGGAPLANPALTGTPTAPNAVLHNSSTQIATTAYVQGELAALPTAPVTSFNTRTGAIVLTTADITGAGGAPSASPALTGVPTAPTAAEADSSTTLATTAFVHAAISALGTTVTSFNGRTGAITLLGNDLSAAGGALLAGPAFTGAPTAPTATVGTATTQIATTAFVQAAIAAISAGVSSFNTRTGAITLTLADVTGAGGAPLAGPHFSGVPTAPTPAQSSNDTTLATTAYVQAAVAAGGVLSFNSRVGAVTLQANDVSAVGGALLASPAFTGVPTSTTAPINTNTTQIATTAFVIAQLTTAGGVTSFNSRAGAVTLSTADIINAGGAPAASPTLTGVPLAPTAAAGTNTTQLATTAFVNGYLPLTGGTLSGQLTVGGNVSNMSIICQAAVSAVQLYNSSGVGEAQFVQNAGVVTVENLSANCYVQLDGNVAAAPASTGNFIVSPGVGFQAGGGSWTALSDARIKTVKDDYMNGLEAVRALRPVAYVYKGNDALPSGMSMHEQAAKDGTVFVGLIAQEAEQVFPDMVTKTAGVIDGQPVTDLRSMNMTPLTFALINAVKTLAGRIEQLEAQRVA